MATTRLRVEAGRQEFYLLRVAFVHTEKRRLHGS
jgi:hypothetical protein